MTSVRQRPSFGSGGDFILDTRREVEAYVQSGRVRRRARQKLYAKTIVAFALWSASYGSLMFAHPGIAVGSLCLAGLILATVLIGFCVQHDANHGAYFGTRRLNHLMGWTSDAFVGFSSYAWRVKHNVAHHTYTNVDGYDDDINQAPFARLTPNQAPKRWYRLQHIYIWPLYSLMVLRWQTGADVAALVRGRIGSSPIKPPRRWALAGLVGGKLIFIGWAIAAPMFVYPWWVVVIGYLTFTGVASLITATTFQLAHCVEEADFASVDQVTERKRIWAVHEVETTVDFCTGNVPLTWVLGGLNYQIEHHLFPQLPHTLYPRIAAIVRRNAAKHGVRYTAQPSLYVALRSHQRHLRGLGRMGRPVAIEMG